MCAMCAHAGENQRRVLDLLELELQAVGYPVWVLRGELGSSAGAQSALFH